MRDTVPPSSAPLASPPSDWPGIAALVVSVTLWGSAFTGIAIMLEAFSPGPGALARFSVAAVSLLALALFRGLPRPTRSEWPTLIALGWIGITTNHLLLNYGQQVIAPGVAALIIQITPALTALLAHHILGERLRRQGWLGIAIASAGAALLVASRVDLSGFTWRALMIVCVSVTTSIYFVGQANIARKHGGLFVTVWTMAAAVPPLLWFAPQLLAEAPAAQAHHWAVIGYLGVFPAAGAYLLWNIGLRRLGASRAAPFMYGAPLAAIATEWLWRGTVPGLTALLGGALAIAGVSLVHRSRRAPGGAL